MKKVIIKNLTNDGSKCKQYFVNFITSDKYPALDIYKLVLCHKSEFDKLLSAGYLPVKKFKDHYLFLQVFGIKLSTLNTAIDQLNKQNK